VDPAHPASQVAGAGEHARIAASHAGVFEDALKRELHDVSSYRLMTWLTSCILRHVIHNTNDVATESRSV
jgi:hypothetical protein